MFKNRNVFICTHYGWEVISDGSDGNPVRIQYRPYGKINGYYDRKRPEQELTCVIEADPERLPEEVSLAFQNFDASVFVWTAAKEYEAKYGGVPPVMSFTDFARFLSSSLEKLCRALEGNQQYDAFEERMAKAAGSCGLDMMIERGHRIDTLRLEYNGACLPATLYKVYSEEEDAYVPDDENARMEELKTDIKKDVRLAEKRTQSPFVPEEVRMEGRIAAEKGRAFLAAMEKNETI